MQILYTISIFLFFTVIFMKDPRGLFHDEKESTFERSILLCSKQDGREKHGIHFLLKMVRTHTIKECLLIMKKEVKDIVLQIYLSFDSSYGFWSLVLVCYWQLNHFFLEKTIVILLTYK